MPKSMDEHLQKLKTLYTDLERIIPIEELTERGIPEGESGERVGSLIRAIFDEMKDLKSAYRDASLRLGDPVIRMSEQNRRFYYDVVQARSELVHQLYSGLGLFEAFISEPISADEQDDMSRRLPFARKAIKAALRYWDDTLDEDDDRRMYHDFETALQVVDAHWFMPDTWASNANRLQPIMLKDSVVLPKGLRDRLKAAYLAYVLCNWLPTVSMARATLEYAILESAKRLGIDVLDRENGRRTAPLSELISRVAEKYPETEENMRRICTSGNAVMHPMVDQKVVEFPTSRKTALRSLEDLGRVLERLYAEG